MKIILASLILVLFCGCQTKNVVSSKITYREDGKTILTKENFSDTSHGCINWSEGAGKNMPFSNVTVSGLAVGK